MWCGAGISKLCPDLADVRSKPWNRRSSLWNVCSKPWNRKLSLPKNFSLCAQKNFSVRIKQLFSLCVCSAVCIPCAGNSCTEGETYGQPRNKSYRNARPVAGKRIGNERKSARSMPILIMNKKSEIMTYTHIPSWTTSEQRFTPYKDGEKSALMPSGEGFAAIPGRQACRPLPILIRSSKKAIHRKGQGRAAFTTRRRCVKTKINLPFLAGPEQVLPPSGLPQSRAIVCTARFAHFAPQVNLRKRI